MENIPFDIISVCVMIFLDEKSIVRFSMTNKKIMDCFLKGIWSIETCIKLIVHVNDILIDKIENILLPIEFRCDKIDLWPLNICDVLRNKKKDKLLKWIQKSTYMFSYRYVFPISNIHGFRLYNIDDDDCYYINYDDDCYYDETYENSIMSEDDDENCYFIRECKKKK